MEPRQMTSDPPLIDRSWIVAELAALNEKRRARKIAALRKKAADLMKMSGTAGMDREYGSDLFIEFRWRALNAAVSCRLLAALAEHHKRPPPDCEDGLHDCVPYDWARVAARNRWDRVIARGSSASQCADLGSPVGSKW